MDQIQLGLGRGRKRGRGKGLGQVGPETEAELGPSEIQDRVVVQDELTSRDLSSRPLWPRYLYKSSASSPARHTAYPSLLPCPCSQPLPLPSPRNRSLHGPLRPWHLPLRPPLPSVDAGIRTQTSTPPPLHPEQAPSALREGTSTSPRRRKLRGHVSIVRRPT